MMKSLVLALICFVGLTASAEEVKQLKRHINGKTAVQEFQKEMRRAAREPGETEELTRDVFAKNFKNVFASYYAKDESGAVIQTRKIETTGKIVSLVGKDAKLTPASAKEVWEFLQAGDTILVRSTLMEPCGFCNGMRYVYYFDEEVKALEAFNDKYHKQHAVKEEKEDDDKRSSRSYRNGYYRDNSDKEEKAQRRRERKEQEFSELCERANQYGWGELSEEVRKAMKLSADDDMATLPCCWTEIHEDGAMRFRHMCPVCKGKVTMKATRLRSFEVSK